MSKAKQTQKLSLKKVVESDDETISQVSIPKGKDSKFQQAQKLEAAPSVTNLVNALIDNYTYKSKSLVASKYIILF
jgi:hypothetical protein